jgi:hypothetical protein
MGLVEFLTSLVHAWLMIDVVSCIIASSMKKHNKGRTRARFIEEGKMGRKLRLKERNCIIGGWYLTIQFC